MWRAGYANQPTSVAADDGLRLTGCYVSAAVRCAPPANKPTVEERDRCVPYLRREIDLLGELRVIVVLGQFAYDAVARLLGVAAGPASATWSRCRCRPRRARSRCVCSFHPEPAEHLHRQADRAHVRRRFHPGPGAGWFRTRG